VPAKIVLSLLVLAFLGGGGALCTTGNIALIAGGVLIALIGVVLGFVSVSMLRDPEAAAQKLLSRRAELEVRTGRAPLTSASQDTAVPLADPPAPLAAPAPNAPANRAERRAADRATRGRGGPSRATRR
jgi:hypothetical protein